MTSITIAVIAIFVTLFLAAGALATRYKVAGPHEALIITGKRGKTSKDLSGQKVVVGGGVFVLPIVQTLSRVPLSSNQIHLQVSSAPSSQGIRLNVQAVAVVKVGGDESHIRAAAQRFLGQTDAIHSFTTEVLEGELRSIVGQMTVESIIRDRAAFATSVAEAAEASLSGQGLTLDSFSIKDVSDSDGTYLADMGRPEAAAVRRNADIAEARAAQEAAAERLKAEEEIANSERALALRQAEIKVETDTALARAAAAGPLEEAARAQDVLAEQSKVTTAQADLTEKQLEVSVRKPADAERYRIEQEAEAARNAQVSRAEADKTAKELAANAEKQARVLAAEASEIEVTKSGAAEKTRREAIAAAVETEGKAQAAAIEAVGSAEAKAMDEKADSYEKYGTAAQLEMLIQVLPQVARELAAPMGNIDKLTVLSTDGASALPKAVANNMSQVLEVVQSMTGRDLTSLLPGKDGVAGPVDIEPDQAA